MRTQNRPKTGLKHPDAIGEQGLHLLLQRQGLLRGGAVAYAHLLEGPTLRCQLAKPLQPPLASTHALQRVDLSISHREDWPDMEK